MNQIEYQRESIYLMILVPVSRERKRERKNVPQTTILALSSSREDVKITCSFAKTVNSAVFNF